MAVVQYWIALEVLADGAQSAHSGGNSRPQSASAFLPPHVSALMALTSARNLIIHLWQMMHDMSHQVSNNRFQEVEGLLSLRGDGYVDLARWYAVLVAADGNTAAPTTLTSNSSVSEIAAVVREVAEDLGPLTYRRLLEVQYLLTNSERLTKWSVGIRNSAEINLTRIKLMRHGAVHRAQVQHKCDTQIRQAGHNILDCVYEVLPYWLKANSVPWEILRDLRKRHDTHIVLWGGGGAVPQFNPETLLVP